MRGVIYIKVAGRMLRDMSYVRRKGLGISSTADEKYSYNPTMVLVLLRVNDTVEGRLRGSRRLQAAKVKVPWPQERLPPPELAVASTVSECALPGRDSISGVSISSGRPRLDQLLQR